MAHIMLDTSKAFDRVKHCQLFIALLERDISPIVLRLFLFMYTDQSLRVKWSNTLSDQFSAMNGVKQGGVLSPILFAVYTDGLLERLQQTGVSCLMSSRFTGALAYADDITLLAPCKSAFSILVSVCEDYAAECDIHLEEVKVNCCTSRADPPLWCHQRSAPTYRTFSYRGAHI